MKRNAQQSELRTRKKAKTGSGVLNDEDRISRLPDELRSYILSKLPASDAVKTSILSKGWKQAWTSVASLEFDFDQFPNVPEKHSAFIEFVNRSLLRHNPGGIRRFHLHLYTYRTRIPYAPDWINFALTHAVQELELYIPKNTWNKLPGELFTCKSLIVLKLGMPFNVLQLPGSVTLPKVQTLHLESMAFRNDNTIFKLISGCPTLENLSMNSCSMHGMKILRISSSELQNLSIRSCRQFSSTKVNICAQKLQSLQHHCQLGHTFPLENLSTLRKVDIEIFGMTNTIRSDKDLANRTVKILHGLHNVETLILSSGCTEHLATAIDLLGSFSCDLSNLRHLDVTFLPDRSYIEVLNCLLKCCSTIETLSAGMDKTQAGSWNMQLFTAKREVPKCPLLNLKNVQLRNLIGAKKLDLVKFLVKNAKALEHVITISEEGVVKERTVNWLKRRAQSQ